MKLLFIGDKPIYIAIKQMLEEMKASSYEFTFYENESHTLEKSYDTIIIDSRWYKKMIPTIRTMLDCNVVVIGPYTDDYTRRAFSPTSLFNYIAYSELESQLLNKLKMPILLAH